MVSRGDADGRTVSHSFVGLHFRCGTCLVDEVDGLVGQETVVDVFGAGLYGKRDGLVVIFHAVELLIVGLQLLQDVLRLVDGGLRDVNLLETAYQTLGTREVTVVFLVGGGADETNLARFEVGLQHVGGVHCAVANGTCSHERVYLVDIDNVRLGFCGIVLIGGNPVHNHLDAFLEVATILRAGQERSHIKLIHLATLQAIRHAPFLDETHQSPDEGGLAHAWLAHMQRVVLVAAAQHLNGALELLFAPNERILLRVEVVHAGDQSAPGLARLLFDAVLLLPALVLILILVLILVFIEFRLLNFVLIFVGADERAQKFTLMAVQRSFQQIAGPGVLQLENAHREMWYVQGVGTTACDLLAGIFNHLAELGRSFGLRCLAFRQLFQFHQFMI